MSGFSPSYRVFVYQLEGEGVSLENTQPDKNPSYWVFAQKHNSSEYLYAQAHSLSEALREIDLLIPYEATIHVLASPHNTAQEYCLRNKKLLHIGFQSGLNDYKNINSLIDNKRLPSAQQRLSFKIETLSKKSEKELVEILRGAQRTQLIEFIQSHNIFDHELLLKLVDKASHPPKMLLHVCCGPDAAGVIHQLKEDFDLTCFWYDPNIQPKQEHDLRLEAFIKIANIEEVPYLVGEYDVDRFYDHIDGLENTPEQGAKCSKCYDMRLERSARLAHEQGFDLYATTLAISPHKVQKKLIAFGKLNETRFGIPYYHRNFMKNDGFKRSVELTEEHSIYRQDYCGCYFSLHEGGSAAQWLGQNLDIDDQSDKALRPLKIKESLYQVYQDKLKLSTTLHKG